jgi:ceramide glucosyltransferase
VTLTITLAALSVVSFALTLWQWLAARRFPIHERVVDNSFAPGLTLLKPLKGKDNLTERCLRSWLEQDYNGSVQILFGVASLEDPVCGLVRELIAQYPKADAALILCSEQLGPNAKVSTLVQLERHARHEFLVISDADVRVPRDLLTNLVAPFEDPGIGLVNCLYQLANPVTLAMHCEAVAINADFWSQVLQARSLKPLSFALGAVMATTRSKLANIGGFAELLDHLADDYHLGNKIAAQGSKVVLCPVVVECWSAPMGWKGVWTHQLRWARTIRVCQPVPFFFSLLSNGTVWPLLWWAASPTPFSSLAAFGFCALRVLTAQANHQRLVGSHKSWVSVWLVPVKDLASTAIWALAFLGNRIEWRGQLYRMLRDGRLTGPL